MRRRSVLKLSLPGVAGAALLAPRARATPSAGEPIRLGQSAPLSGPMAAVGRACRDAARAVFAEVNAQGGIGGRDIELVTLDDEDRAERSAVNVKLLATQHRVIAVFGCVGAGAHRAAARAAAAEGLPYVAAFSGSQELRSGLLPWVYNLRAGHADEVEYIARHTRHVGIERVSLLSEYNSQGWELRDALLAALEARGTSAASISSVDQEGSRYSLPGAVSSVLAGQPQAILLGADHVASARFVEAVRRAGFTGLFYTLSTVGGTALTERLGPEAAGLSVTQVVPFPWTTSTPLGRQFQAFCLRHRLEPSFAGMEAYLAAQLMADGLRRMREPAPARLAEALDGLAPRDFGGFVGAFYGRARRASAQVDLTVFSRTGKFVR